MGLEAGYERSFKAVPGKLLANRYLIALATQSLTPEQAVDIGRRLGLPDGNEPAAKEPAAKEPAAKEPEFWSDFSEANTLLIGFEDSQPGCVYKLYLEFKDRIIAELAAAPARPADAPSRHVLHRGVKWRADDPSQLVQSLYLAHPRISADEISRRVSVLTQASPIEAPLREILNRVLAKVPGESLIYVEVDEGDQTRASFDLNVYQAALSVGEIFADCRQAMLRLDIPESSINALQPLVHERPFGHLAAGTSRDGEPFLTIYYDPGE